MKPSLAARVLELYAWTPAELARVLHVAQPTVYRWLGGAKPVGLARAVLEALASAGARLPPKGRELLALHVADGLGPWIRAVVLFRDGRSSTAGVASPRVVGRKNRRAAGATRYTRRSRR